MKVAQTYSASGFRNPGFDFFYNHIRVLHYTATKSLYKQISRPMHAGT